MGQEPQDQDIDLMPRASEVAPQSPPPSESQPVPSEKGEVVLLDDDLVMDVYTLSFDESQQRIVQARRKQLLNDHTSLVHIEERVIVSNAERNPAAMAKDSKAYVEATCSTINFLIVENDRMAEHFQKSR